MNYRKFGNIDFEVSALGFGCMRLPTRGKDANIDEPLAVEMLRYAIDQGVNYLDTAYVYHGGNSESLVGKALASGYRDKVKVATKLPPWSVEKTEDFDRLLNEQSAKLKTEHIDFYLLHNMNRTLWPKLRDLGVIPWAEKALADGRIGNIGFSFHDDLPVFREILDDYDGWSFCQIQYNYMGENVQAGADGLRDAAARSLAVVVMEPLMGGVLANPPEEISTILDGGRKRTPADWALQWLWNQEEVSVVLSGMSTMEQVRQNVQSACRSSAGSLAAGDLERMARARDAYQRLRPIPCTKCRYCMPCPNGVDIPTNLELYNDAVAFKNSSNARSLCRNLYAGVPENERAGACDDCKTCEPKCPQSIEVSSWMPRVHDELTK